MDKLLVQYSTDVYPVCPVCGVPKTKLQLCRNFGVLCCNGCAAFFRRSSIAGPLECLGQPGTSCARNVLRQNEGVPEPKKVRVCRHCRYQNCLKIGMKPPDVNAPPRRYGRLREPNLRRSKAEEFPMITQLTQVFCCWEAKRVLDPSCKVLGTSLAEESFFSSEDYKVKVRDDMNQLTSLLQSYFYICSLPTPRAFSEVAKTMMEIYIPFAKILCNMHWNFDQHGRIKEETKFFVYPNASFALCPHMTAEYFKRYNWKKGSSKGDVNVDLPMLLCAELARESLVVMRSTLTVLQLFADFIQSPEDKAIVMLLMFIKWNQTGPHEELKWPEQTKKKIEKEIKKYLKHTGRGTLSSSGLEEVIRRLAMHADEYRYYNQRVRHVLPKSAFAEIQEITMDAAAPVVQDDWLHHSHSYNEWYCKPQSHTYRKFSQVAPGPFVQSLGFETQPQSNRFEFSACCPYQRHILNARAQSYPVQNKCVSSSSEEYNNPQNIDYYQTVPVQTLPASYSDLYYPVHQVAHNAGWTGWYPNSQNGQLYQPQQEIEEPDPFAPYPELPLKFRTSCREDQIPQSVEYQYPAPQ
ncbi:hypothetical protein L596_005118 [Steinernema carpocapsae]|uniref:Nuclear receptor domain-containing protein n=1 Tax=Steinernema carpocapsae TaxID=34508 RepID=A0A4U8UZJ9_STECR|nr:hypothetical protein L596_005118 [Steinernema carpocapsae]